MEEMLAKERETPSMLILHDISSYCSVFRHRFCGLLTRSLPIWLAPALLVALLGAANSTIVVGCTGNPVSCAPNTIISVFGSGIGPANAVTLTPDSNGLYPTQAGGFAITFDGTAAPLLYASSGQVNLVTPGSLAAESTTQICASVNGTATNCISMPVAPAAPQIFTTGPPISQNPELPDLAYAAALNEDGSVNSQENPAAGGSIVSLFVTGLGAVTPTVADGAVTPIPIPVQDLKVAAAACPYEYLDSCAFLGFGAAIYAGPAPLEIEGLGQVNLQLPSQDYPAADAYGVAVDVVLPDGTFAVSQLAAIWTK